MNPDYEHIIKLLAPRIAPVSKAWGEEYWVVNNDKYCMKLLHLHPGYQCSLHYHKVKDETFIVIAGNVRLEKNDFTHHMSDSQKLRIAPGDVHRFSSYTGALIIEVSTHHDDADSYRIEESRKIDQ